MEIGFLPPRRVFQVPVQDRTQRTQEGGYSLDGFTHVSQSKNGGMLSHYAGHPYPLKGMVHIEGVEANNKVKRITLALLMPLASKEIIPAAIGFLLTPYKWKIKFTEKVLANYIRLADSIYMDCDRVPYYHKEYYCEFSKGLWDVTSQFLQGLGVSAEIAEKIGLITATLFQFDDAYKVRAQDILTESSAEAFLANPRKELLRLMQVFKQRESHIEETVHAGGRILAVSRILSFALLLPKVKRAFKQALASVDFTYLQMDEIDRYWALSRQDYQVEGRSFEERFQEHVSIAVEHIKKETGKDVIIEPVYENGVQKGASWSTV